MNKSIRLFGVLMMSMVMLFFAGCGSDDNYGGETNGGGNSGGGTGGGGGGNSAYTVTFNSNGGSAVAKITGVKKGDKISKPTDPTKSESIFDSWHKTSALNSEWDFARDVVDSDITLYAKWRGKKRQDKTFTTTGKQTYTFDAFSKPATIEIYALGAGGAGGGYVYERSYSCGFLWLETCYDRYQGTGGSGGGGAAAYVSFSADKQVDFEITVGKGGAGGSYEDGYLKTDGESTIVNWNDGKANKLEVKGGKGGYNISGGEGGATSARPENVNTWTSAAGGKGGNGLEAGFQVVTAGNAASIKNTGSLTSFGGGLGGQLLSKTDKPDGSYTYTYYKPGIGAGGNSAPGYSKGGVGGNGEVTIVITYYE